jgi:PAS domain S-box-containing protein
VINATYSKSDEQPVDFTRQFQNLLRQIPAAIAVVRGPTFTYILANAYYQETFGRSESDLIGKKITDVYPEARSQGIFELFERTYSSGEAFQANEFEAEYCQNGVLVKKYFNFIIQPLEANGMAEMDMLIHAVDVTESVMNKRNTEETWLIAFRI